MPRSRNHVLSRCVLRHECRRSGLQGTEQVLVAGVHGQHHDPKVRVALPQLAYGVESTAVGKPDVHQHHVGLGLGSDGKTFGDGRRFADDGEVFSPLECPAKSLSDQIVVVDQQHLLHVLGNSSRPCCESA